MPSFREQAIRLLRDDWPSTKMLAEEVYAILSQELEYETSGGLTLDGQGSGGGRPLTFRDFSDGDTIIRIRRPDGTFDDITPLDLLGEGGDGEEDEEELPQSTLSVAEGVVVSRASSTHYLVTDADTGDEYEARCIPATPSGDDLPAGARVPLLLSSASGEVTATITVATWQ
jgi:hypothetical protein